MLLSTPFIVSLDSLSLSLSPSNTSKERGGVTATTGLLMHSVCMPSKVGCHSCPAVVGGVTGYNPIAITEPFNRLIQTSKLGDVLSNNNY